MKVNKLFLGLFVCTAFCACSNDEPEVVSENVTTTETPKVFTGDEAYICIRLADAGSLKRATSPEPGYEYGEADEQKVENAYFYFYDAEGNFVSQGSAWNGGKANGADPAANIEFNANTVAVLKGLTEKNYPKYMVTVLNRPADFEYGMTLNEMEKKLSEGTASGIMDGKNFVMSTTSYKHTNGTRYFVTEVEEKHFLKEPVNLELTTDNYVTVYVERLAAKVTLKTDLANTMVDGMYEITASVAGENNDNGVTEGTNQWAVEKLYVKLLGWTLNATSKESYIVKNINEAWAEQFGDFTWNKESDSRSFWGMSTCYGKADGYPTDAATYAGPYNLNYVNLATTDGTIGKSLYCAENTNTSAVVTANFPSAVTSILLKAEVCDKDGKGLDLVRFNGLLFNKARFLEYILNVVNGKSGLNAWVKTSAEDAAEAEYKQIDATYVELVNVADGEVKVALNEKAKKATLYTRGAYDATTQKYTFTEGADLTKIDENLKEESADAVGYKGGLMYYNIPIEHLNNAAVVDGVTPEAKYGIVRNHHYVVTVNKLEHVGQGIFNPDEVIVPGDGRDDEYYYVGANINILSWKLVNQTVGL